MSPDTSLSVVMSKAPVLSRLKLGSAETKIAAGMILALNQSGPGQPLTDVVTTDHGGMTAVLTRGWTDGGEQVAGGGDQSDGDTWHWRVSVRAAQSRVLALWPWLVQSASAVLSYKGTAELL
ncbi:hypothetical protein Tco_0779002 [Tanacetum coccineum]